MLNIKIKNFKINRIKHATATKNTIEHLDSSYMLQNPSLENIIQTPIKKDIITITNVFKLFSGLQTSCKTTRPVKPKSTAEIEEISPNPNENSLENICTDRIINKLQTPPGNAFLSTFFINLPRTRSVLGSIVNKNDGKPIVIALINVN